MSSTTGIGSSLNQAIAQAPDGVRAVLIDLDGTMVDSAPDIVEAANRMLADVGAASMSAAMVVSFIGNGVPTLVRRLLAASPALAGMDGTQAQAQFYRHYHDTNGRFSRLFPGVLDGLAVLKEAGYLLACVTNKPMDYTEALLQSFGLAPLLQAVVAGDTLARMKPDPAPLLHACLLLGVPPQAAVMVGDSQVDVAAARAAGMPAYILRYGYPGPGGLEALGADFLIDSLIELPALLV
ncbi:MAG: phosphoglycolate phosphatase [Herminiimonas sp.]|nr:phosphoglycolate phosphatase [Herminiimonas sp.]